MALKLLFFLAILKMASSVPDPDPYNNIHINVQQIVNGGGCCPEPRPCDPKVCTNMGQLGVCGREAQPPFIKEVGCQECEDECKCYIEGCVFGDKVYANGAIAQDTCVELQCIEGVWNYTGNSDNLCGYCRVWGDPHIHTYDPHNLIGGDNPIADYESFIGITGEFVISQQGLKPVPSLFGVYANFTTCGDGVQQACVSRVNYTEPGIEVQLILPEKLDDSDYCITAASADPKCATKILVNGEERYIGNDGSVSSFYGADGTVLIFKAGACNSTFCHMYVVGSKGITVSLEINPNFSYEEWYQLDIHPIPSLQHQLFGLCDTFTGALTDNYTLQDGTLMTIWNDSDLDKFIDSWEVPSN